MVVVLHRGDPVGFGAPGLVLLADARLEQGDALAAVDDYRRAGRVYGTLTGHWGQPMAELFAARALLVHGHLDPIDVASFRTLSEHELPMVRASALGMWATHQAMSGEHADALGTFERGWAELTDPMAERLWGYLHRLSLAATLQVEGRTDAAQEELMGARDQLQALNIQPGVAACDVLQAAFDGGQVDVADVGSFARIALQVLGA